jgi:Regulator of Chromosome Condensation (RCC1) repeat protein
VAWGRNNVSQSVTPAGNDYVQISCGGAHNLALKSNGTLVAWGADEYGQSNVPAGMKFRQVAGGGEHTIAIKSDGSLAAWGYNSSGQINVPAGNTYLAVAGGAFHSMALKARDSYQDLLIGNESTLTGNDTLLQRNVTVTGNVTIDGALDWQGTTGRLNVAGTVTVNPGSTLSFLPDGADLTHRQDFQVVNDSNAIIGQFDTINLPALAPQFHWDTSQLYSSGIIQIAPEPNVLGLLLIAGQLLLLIRSGR